MRASCLQERFTAVAARLDGATVLGAEAWGKHLFLAAVPVGLGGQPLWLHVHLGLYGRFTHGGGEPAAPRGQLRLRLVGERGWADLRGAITSELLQEDERRAAIARLGADPLRPRADPMLPWARISRSRVGIGALLMQQDVIAGVGNVYRAEVLFRHGIGPHRPGRSLELAEWLAIWADLCVLMRAGVRAGRIITTLPADRARPGGRVRREDACYVYRRAGLACRRCGAPVQTELLAGRKLYWCPIDQPE